MYSLFARVDATQRVCTAFSAYIVERGKAAVATPEKDKEMVTTLLELKVGAAGPTGHARAGEGP